MPKILMPPAWRVIASGHRRFACEAASVREALASLFEHFPQLRERVLNAQGEVVSYVTIFVGDEDIRRRQGLETPVTADTTIAILPAIVGG